MCVLLLVVLLLFSVPQPKLQNDSRREIFSLEPILDPEKKFLGENRFFPLQCLAAQHCTAYNAGMRTHFFSPTSGFVSRLHALFLLTNLLLS
jgi:hypothetical protein